MKRMYSISGVSHRTFSAAIVVIIFGAALFIFFQPQPEEDQPQPEEEEEHEILFTQFTRLPFDIEYVGSVNPVGNLMGTHTRSNPNTGRPYGIERHIISHKSTGVPYNVYAPATTYITSVRKSLGIGDYGFDFKMDENSSFRFDHIHVINSDLESKILEQLGGTWEETSPFVSLPTPILVYAGDILGQTGVEPESVNWDWFVGEGSDYNEGILVPEHYTITSMGRLFASAKSAYDFASDEVKQQLESLAGYWTGAEFIPSEGLPVLGQCGDDTEGTLSGIWFYDYTDNSTWGPKLAGFIPYFLDTGQLYVKLAIPEVDLYGIWVITTNASGNINLDPKTVTSESGIVYYTLNNPGNDENGLLMVQVNSDGTIKLDTHKDSFDPAAFPNFTGSELTLSR